MPSFDIVSEVDKQETDNALNQARKELATRFDFKGSAAEIIYEKDKITLTAEDANRLRGLREIVISKLSKRGVDLRNIEQVEPDISPLGHARQELKIQQGLEGEKAKEIIKAIKEAGFKVQSALQDRQIRVTGKKKDELQSVIQFVRGKDFKVATNFKNFRNETRRRVWRGWNAPNPRSRPEVESSNNRRGAFATATVSPFLHLIPCRCQNLPQSG
jgi:cyclic-di-GMP-binding protein